MAEYKGKLFKGLFTRAKNVLLSDGRTAENACTWTEINTANWATEYLKYKEIMIVLKSSSLNTVMTTIVVADDIPATNITLLFGGWYIAANDNGGAYLVINKTTIGSYAVFKNGTQQTVTLTLYGK